MSTNGGSRVMGLQLSLRDLQLRLRCLKLCDKCWNACEEIFGGPFCVTMRRFKAHLDLVDRKAKGHQISHSFRHGWRRRQRRRRPMVLRWTNLRKKTSNPLGADLRAMQGGGRKRRRTLCTSTPLARFRIGQGSNPVTIAYVQGVYGLSLVL